MTLCKFSLPYRSKPEYDQDDFEATIDLRQFLGKHLDSFCSDLPEFVKWVIDNLSLIRHDNDWVEHEADKIWPLLEGEYPAWVQIACDGRSEAQDWRASGWLDNWPDDLAPKALLSAARGGRLNAHRTAIVLKKITDRIKKQLASVQKEALGDLHVRLPQEKEAKRQATKVASHIIMTQTRSQDQSRQKPRTTLTDRERKIWAVIQLGVEGPQYCRELENGSIRPQRTGVWKDCPAGTYLAAYQLGEPWRHRIQDEKSRIKRKGTLAGE